MKKYIFLFCLFPILGNSQSGPGGVGNSSTNEIWLIAEDNSYTDAGTTKGANGSSIQQWNDISGNNNHSIQTTNSQKPTLQTNLINGHSALRFDGSNDRILSAGVSTNNQLTIYVVMQHHTLPHANSGIVQGSPSGSAFTTGTKSVGMWTRNNGRIWGRGVQSNSTNRNISQVTTLSTNTFYAITQDYNGSNINQYVNATISGTVTYNNTLSSWADFGVGRQGTETMDGDVAEVIVYRVSNNSAQRIIINNYLAAKYGLTLTSNDIYDEDNSGNGDYDHEVAGIGRVDASNQHSDAQGTGIVRINNPTGLGNDEFLIWGHNGDTAKAYEYTDVPAGVQARFEREWRVSEVNSSGVATGVDVGAVDIGFDLSGLGSVTASDLRLLVDTDNDGVFSDETPISGATLSGGLYTFSGVTALTNNVRFTIGTINVTQTPLPVELVEFTANTLEGQAVSLDWMTASEINNDYFVVEKSQDAIQWTEIGQVKGAGNSTDLVAYKFIDKYPSQGENYYRLKQVDYDGKYEYSPIIMIVRNDTERPIKIYPIPTKDKLTIQGLESEISTINISTLDGENVNMKVQFLDTDLGKEIDISGLSSGMYFLNTASNSYRIIKE